MRAILLVLIACALLLPGGGVSAADEVKPENQEDEEGYPEQEGRRIGGPTDVEADLDNSFPQKDSVFGAILPHRWAELKKELYQKTNLKLGFSAHSLYQRASATMGSNDYAWGGWLLFEGKWDAVRHGEDYAGSLAFAIDWRDNLGGATPALFGTFDVGSLWPTDLAFAEWDTSITVLYWEQWFKKDRAVLRVGKQLAAQIYDFFRFKDNRVAFSSDPTTTHASIPAPGFGQGLSLQSWPRKDSELYFIATVNDMNGDPEDLGLDTFFDERQYFYGVELGYFWRRDKSDFDHLHFDLFYADKKDSQLPFLPNESGWGFKLLGSKQYGRLVNFGSYTYNEAEGGGFGITFGKQTVNAGMAVLKPLGIRGEIGVSGTWMEPVNPALRNQYGVSTYWKLLLTPDLWITPGLQLIFDPAFNPSEDSVGIYEFKFRFFF